MKIAFIVGSLENGRDGVGDYTRSLATECVKQGHSCALLSFNDRWLTTPDSITESIAISDSTNIDVLRLSHLLSWRERISLAQNFLTDFDPDWASLQFVCYAFHFKGIVRDLAVHLCPLLVNRRVHVMFHETWIGAYEEARYKERIVGKLQKYYILQLMRSIKPAAVHTSNDSYVYLLAQNGIRAEILPMFGSIPIVSETEEKWLYEAFGNAELDLNEADRGQWWIFGFFGSLSSSWPTEPLFSVIHQAALACGRRVLIASIGRLGDEEHWNRIVNEYSNRLHFLKLGELPADKVSQYLQFIDFGIAPTPCGQIGKSSAAAAMTEHGLPVIVNRDDWHLKGLDSLISCSDSLLHKLDDALEEKIISGISKRKPENMLSLIASKFLSSLYSAAA